MWGSPKLGGPSPHARGIFSNFLRLGFLQFLQRSPWGPHRGPRGDAFQMWRSSLQHHKSPCRGGVWGSPRAGTFKGPFQPWLGSLQFPQGSLLSVRGSV